MRVLFLSSWFPYPPNNGSKLRIYNLLRGLATRHEVDLLTFDNGDVPGAPPELQELCTDIEVYPKPAYRPGSACAVAGFLSPRPRVLVDTFSRPLAEAIRHRAASGRYDLVIASEWATAAYCRHWGQVPALLEDLEMGMFHSGRDAAGTLARFRNDLTLLKLRHYLRRLLPRFRACTVVSQEEAALARRFVPGFDRVEVVPNCVDLATYAVVDAPKRPDTLVFAGSFRYSTNYDAMRWFLAEVYPLIKAERPAASLTITGDHAGLPLPPAADVTRTGFVGDVRPLVASSSVSVVPIRAGGGTRLKILEAMALRTPVVATAKGAEGLEAVHGEHLLIADTPAEFAEAVLLLVRNATLRQRLTGNAHRLVAERYDWPRVMPRFLDLVDRVATG